MDSSRLSVKHTRVTPCFWQRNRLQSYIRPPRVERIAPGHHGIRAPGATRLTGLRGATIVIGFTPVADRPLCHGLMFAVRCDGEKFLLC
jgi:hypothetical protein